jgi:ribosomal protein S18 acetylase RimI-like enzyme
MGEMVPVRPCNTSDLDDCAKLFVGVFAEPPYRERWGHDEALAYLRKFLSFDPRHCYVAVLDGEVIGALFGYRYPWRDRSEYYIQEIFVRRDRRGRGVGTDLMRHAVQRLGGDAVVSLVANEKTKASRFYEKLGITQHPYYKFYSGRVQSG